MIKQIIKDICQDKRDKKIDPVLATESEIILKVKEYLTEYLINELKSGTTMKELYFTDEKIDPDYTETLT